jgi:hypothetical protein
MPLVLLMEYETEWGNRERKRYLLSNVVEIVDDMSPHTREWLASVLADISSDQFLNDLSTDERFSRYDSLNVGPLRTAFIGVFECGGLSEAFAAIKRAVMSNADDINGILFFPDVFFPFDRNPISTDMKYGPFPSNR